MYRLPPGEIQNVWRQEGPKIKHKNKNNTMLCQSWGWNNNRKESRNQVMNDEETSAISAVTVLVGVGAAIGCCSTEERHTHAHRYTHVHTILHLVFPELQEVGGGTFDWSHGEHCAHNVLHVSRNFWLPSVFLKLLSGHRLYLGPQRGPQKALVHCQYVQNSKAVERVKDHLPSLLLSPVQAPVPIFSSYISLLSRVC